MSICPHCVRYRISLTAWKTNAYADEEQPPRHGWERRPLVRGVALGGWIVHGAVLHLLLLECIGVQLSLHSCRLLDLFAASLQSSVPPSSSTSSRPSSYTTITVYSCRVCLRAHTTTQSAASSLDQSTSKLFPAPKPSRQGRDRPTLYIHPLCTPRSVR